MNRPFRYPTSAWILRRILWALGYGGKRFPSLRTSARVFKDGAAERRTPYSEAEFVADALDLMMNPDVSTARAAKHAAFADGHAELVLEGLRRYDRMRGRLNSTPSVSAGGTLAAIPILRLVVTRLAPMLGGMSVLLSIDDLDRVLNPFARDALPRLMTRFMARVSPEATWEERYSLIDGAVREQSPSGAGVSKNTLVRYRTEAPGKNFRFDRLVAVVEAVSALLEIDWERPVFEVRWFAACARLREQLDGHLGSTLAGDRWVDDLSGALSAISVRVWQLLRIPNYPEKELDAHIQVPPGAKAIRREYLEHLGIAASTSEQELEGLRQLRGRVDVDDIAREDARRGFAMVATVGARLPLIGAVLMPKILGDMAMHEHVAAWAAPGGLLGVWHRLIEEAFDPKTELLVGVGGRELAERLLVMTASAAEGLDPDRKRWARIVHRVVVERGGADLEVGNRDMLRVFLGTLSHAGASVAELSNLGIDVRGMDPEFAQMLEVDDALRERDWAEALPAAIAFWNDQPEEPVAHSRLARAAGGNALYFARWLFVLEQLDEADAVSEEVLEDIATGCVSSLRLLDGLMTLAGDDLPVFRAWAGARIGVAELIGWMSDEASESSAEDAGSDDEPDTGDDLLLDTVHSLEGAVAVFPDDGELRALLARGLDLLGYRGEALEHAKEATRLGHPSAWRKIRES
jgi:hypothetical protein